MLEPLAALHRQSHPKADLALLQRAYDVAEAAHAGQKRKSGDPYITHPLAVATDPGRAGHGHHDAGRGAAARHGRGHRRHAGDDHAATSASEVAHLVDGVTKIDKVKLGDAAQAETIRKMIVAMARDPRVLVIKLADRLHNMRTLRFLPPEKQEKKARETLEILAPLAHRLGMNTIKWELEDLAFATLYPKRYDEIVRLVAERAPSRDTYLAEVTSTVNEQLKAAKIEAVVTGRPKHYYSIYQKMIVRGRDFTDIWDLVGIRILVDSVRDCYAALGIMHAHWQPVPGPLQGLRRDAEVQHVPVAAHHGDRPAGQAGRAADPHARHAPHRRVRHRRALEVQGEGAGRRQARAPASSGAPKVGSPDDMLWLRQLLDWQREAQEPGEFLETLRYDLGPQEVFVFTPKGDVISLPGESTPVDFAYAVHTEVGHRTHRRPGQRLAGLAGQQAVQRRRRRDLHLPLAHGRAVAGLAAVRRLLPGAHQDPAVVHQGAPRGRRRGRQGGPDPRDAQGRAAAAAAARRRRAVARWPRTSATPTSPRSTRRWGRTRSPPPRSSRS